MTDECFWYAIQDTDIATGEPPFDMTHKHCFNLFPVQCIVKIESDFNPKYGLSCEYSNLLKSLIAYHAYVVIISNAEGVGDST